MITLVQLDEKQEVLDKFKTSTVKGSTVQIALP